jgi:hypothetical protein
MRKNRFRAPTGRRLTETIRSFRLPLGVGVVDGRRPPCANATVLSTFEHPGVAGDVTRDHTDSYNASVCPRPRGQWAHVPELSSDQTRTDRYLPRLWQVAPACRVKRGRAEFAFGNEATK